MDFVTGLAALGAALGVVNTAVLLYGLACRLTIRVNESCCWEAAGHAPSIYGRDTEEPLLAVEVQISVTNKTRRTNSVVRLALLSDDGQEIRLLADGDRVSIGSRTLDTTLIDGGDKSYTDPVFLKQEGRGLLNELPFEIRPGQYLRVVLQGVLPSRYGKRGDHINLQLVAEEAVGWWPHQTFRVRVPVSSGVRKVVRPGAETWWGQGDPRSE